MKRALIIIILSVTFSPESFYCVETEPEKSPQCKSWGNVRDFLQNMDRFHLVLQVQEMKCSLNPECSGLSCSGMYQKSHFICDIRINPCDNPIHIQVNLSIPALNISNYSYSICDGDKFTIPAISVPVEISLKQRGESIVVGLSGETGGLLQILPVANETFSVSVCNINQSVPSPPSTIITKTSTTRTVLNVLSTAGSLSSESCKTNTDCNASETCSIYKCQCLPGSHKNDDGVCVYDPNKNTSRTCNMSLLGSCRKNEICSQFNISSIGFCVCRDNFSLGQDGNCLADSDKPKSSVALSLAIAIPILILIACAGVALLVVKLRLVSRCRDRRGIRTYEVVDIGNDDDEPLVT